MARDTSHRGGTATVDFSAHLYPEPIYSEYHDGPPVTPALTDPEQLAVWYEGTGVESAVLSQPLFMGHHDGEATARANDVLLDVIHDYDQFFGLAAIPVAAGPEAAAEEFERCLDAGYHGGALATDSGGVELVDDDIEPVLKVAETAGAPLLVHPKLDESLHPNALDSHRLNNVFGREVTLAASICKVIHEGVLDRFPELNLVYHHSGGNIASMMGRLWVQLDEGRWPDGDTRVYDDNDHLEWFPSFKETLEERIYLDTSGYGGYPAPLRAALEEFPASNIVLGSDGPVETRTSSELVEMVEMVADLTPATETRQILGETAFDLLVNV